MRTLAEMLQSHPSVTNEVVIGYEREGREIAVMSLNNKDGGMTESVFLHMVLDMRITLAACHKNGNEIKLFGSLKKLRKNCNFPRPFVRCGQGEKFKTGLTRPWRAK